MPQLNFKMPILATIFVLSVLFKLSWADMKRCSEENDKVELCLLGEGAQYVDPNNLHTVKMDTILYIKDIIEIDTTKNDIRVQLDLWSYWTDPGLALTNETV